MDPTVQIAGEYHPYMLRRLDAVSFKPILSVGDYLSLDVECIVAGSSDRTIRFLDTETLDEVAKSTMDKKNVSFVAISGMSPEGDDPVIVTGGKDSIIQVWDPTAGSVDKSIQVPTTEVRSLAVYQGSKILVVIGTKDGQVFVWDVVDNRQVAQFRGHQASVHCVCIALTTSDLLDFDSDIDKLCIASGGADRSVRTWDIRTGKRIKRFRHQRSISSIIVTNKGIRPLLATAGVERVIKLWDLESGVLLRSLDGHLDQINTISLWEGYQMLLISGSTDHTIRVYDMLSGECICILTGHRDAVLSVTIANIDNPKIVSSSEDLSMIQWDLNQIIADFYEVDGDFIGARNRNPPHLPVITYQAPEELDKNAMSREERKRIRKERKRAKRIKNLYHDWQKSSGVGTGASQENDDDDALFGDDLFLEQDDDQPSENIAVDQNLSSLQEIQPQPDLSQLHKDISKQEQESQLIQQFTSPADEMKSMTSFLITPENEEEEGEDIDAWFSNEIAADDHQSVKVNGSVKMPEVVPPTGYQDVQHQQAAAQVTISNVLTNAMSKVMPILNHSSSSGSVTTENGVVIMRRSTSIVRGILENVLGMKSTVAVEIPPDVSAQPAVVQPTFGTDFTPVMDSSLSVDVVEPIPTHVPIIPDKIRPPSPISVNVEPISPVVPSTTEIPSADATVSLAIKEEDPPIGKESTQTVSKPLPVVHDEHDYKALAIQAKNKHNIAVVEHQIATDLMKSKASEKLAMRLNLKKKQANGPSTDDGDNETDAELMALKAKKLEQHKLQEARRQQSMIVAKQRSANALQKRLEDLATKKKQQLDGGKSGKMKEIFESADDNSDED
jgi:WD40 repeat protein